jgi:CBS domain-containing protein
MLQRKLAVGDVMTRKVVSVNPKDDLHACTKMMVRKSMNSIPLIEKEKLVGMIFSRDILWAFLKKPDLNLKKIKVIDIARKKVAVIKPSAMISEALVKMRNYGFKRLPVLSNGKMIGIITIKDILKIDPSLYSDLGELAEIKEQSYKLSKAEDPEIYSEGFCEECDSFSSLLKIDGKMLCLDCRYDLD